MVLMRVMVDRIGILLLQLHCSSKISCLPSETTHQGPSLPAPRACWIGVVYGTGSQLMVASLSALVSCRSSVGQPHLLFNGCRQDAAFTCDARGGCSVKFLVPQASPTIGFKGKLRHRVSLPDPESFILAETVFPMLDQETR